MYDDLIDAARRGALGSGAEEVASRIGRALEVERDPVERGSLLLAAALLRQGDADPAPVADLARAAWELLRSGDDVGTASYAAALAAGLTQRCGEFAEAVDLAVDAMVLLDDVTNSEQEMRTANALAVVFAQLAAFDLATEFAERGFRGSEGMADHAREICAYTLAFATVEGYYAVGGDAPQRWVDLAGEAADWFGASATTVVGRELIGPGVALEVAMLAGDEDRQRRLLGGDDGSDPPVYDVAASRLVAWHQLVRASALGRCGAVVPSLALLDRAVPTLEGLGDDHRLARAMSERAAARARGGDGAGALDDALTLVGMVRGRQVERVGRLASQLSRRAELERARVHLSSQAERLAQEAVVDVVTGVGNRRWLEHRLDELALAPGDGTVVVIDLDRFKHVNDRFGHVTGDVVLGRLGALLQSLSGPDVVAARYGGEEFVVVLLGADLEAGQRLAEELRGGVAREAWGTIHPGLLVTLSAGVAAGPLSDVRTVLREADIALYEAKRAGRDRVVVVRT